MDKMIGKITLLHKVNCMKMLQNVFFFALDFADLAASSRNEMVKAEISQ